MANTFLRVCWRMKLYKLEGDDKFENQFKQVLLKTPLLKLIFLLVLNFAFCAKAQQYPVRYLGIESGLSNNSVICILQDHYGFVWFGTYDGLNRYDGYQFKTFRNKWNDPSSLCNNHVKAIAEVKNRIYVGTEKGLMYLNLADMKFHPLYVEDEKRQPVKIDFGINHLLAHNGQVFASTGKHGLLRFEGNDTVAYKVPVRGLRKPYQAQATTSDLFGNIWVYVNGVGLGSLGPPYSNIHLADRTVVSVSSLATDKNNNIWIGTNNGVYQYNSFKSGLKRFDDAQHPLLATNISCLTFTSNAEMWIANNGAGINVYHFDTGKLTYILPGEAKEDLKSGSVFDVFEDNEKRIWVATLRGGVNIIDRHRAPFVNYAHEKNNPNSVPNNFIRSFMEDQHHNIWIGTDGSGLTYWDRAKETFTHYRHGGAGTISSNLVTNILEDDKKVVWVATFNGGIDAFNPQTHRFKHYATYKANSTIEEKNFWNLFEDARQRLWATSTWGGCVYLYNRPLDKFEIVDPRLTDIHAFYVDKAGNMWGGNYTQLVRIDPVNRKHRFYNIGQAVRAITQSADGKLWVGTEGGGLLLFNPATGTFARYTTSDGLPSNSVLNILVDDDKNLWCSTYNGLSNFNVTTRKFTNYFASDGLQSNQFQYAAALKLSSGEMMFGGISGFSIFHPKKVQAYVHTPLLRFTDLTIDNVSVSNNPAYSNNQPVNAVKTIKIPFYKASIGISYTALEYSFPEKIAYAYYLEGWDHSWNYVGNLKTVNYSRLNEGKYVLKIRSTNTAGAWGKPLTINLVVLPPWYRTWWAYLLYVAVVAGALYQFWQYRIRQTRLKYEIEIAQLKMEKEKETNERKLSFFTNVSHEFRTPLTLIINPIKDLLKINKGGNEELNIVYRNANRLLGMVDHLLMFRKSESENGDLKISVQNFSDLCHEVFACFTHQAKIKGIEFSFHTESPEITIYSDREKIEIAIFNLISNALKFTPKNGRINIHVRQDERFVYFEIADTGIGIHADVGEKLFDKFYQVRDANSLKTGFGIGLYLVKNFIDLHKGTVNYKSVAGEGTTFILSLPKGRAHLQDYPLVEPPQTVNAYVEELIDADLVQDASAEVPDRDLELMISNHQSILIIDDNAELRDYVRSIFEKDYSVYEADDGLSGLNMIRKILPDVVISDIVMPNLSGIELCKTVKNDSQLSHIPIILLTGESASEMKLQGIEEGAVDYINKPFEKDLLVARVKGIIKNKRELQNYFFNEVTLKNESRNISEENKQFLYKCIEIIENSLTDPVLEVNAIADKMGMSHSNLYKRIKNITGQTINGFIRFVRLRKAAELLIQTNCNVNEAAFRVGFSDVKYFREHFHKQFGLNPSEFIKRHRVAFQQGKKRG